MIPSEVRVLEYLDATGASPFGDWFDGLDGLAAAKVTVALARIGQGNLSNVKGVGAGVLEYRIDFGPGLPGLFRTGRRRSGDIARRRHQATTTARHCNGAGAVGGLQKATKEGKVRWR